jgi:hypothetical protein
VNVFDRLTTQLSSVETKIEEKHQAMFLLTLLPPSYNTLVGTETLKVKMLKNFVGAFVVNFDSRRGRSGSRGKNDREKSISKSRPRKDIKKLKAELEVK